MNYLVRKIHLSLQENIYSKSPVWLQHVFVSLYGYGWKRRRFGGIFQQEYFAAKERENFTPAQWQQYSEEHLQKILLHAFHHVPYYRETFLQHGINEQKIKTITPGTIYLLPILQREALRKYGATTLTADIKEKHGQFFSSSGSTGSPVKILYSHAMHQRWFALFERSVRNWAGVSSYVMRGMIGGRKIIPSAVSKPPFYRYNYFEKQVYFSAYHINTANAKNYLHGIQKFEVQYMTGYAMSNFFLANFFKKLQLQAPVLKAVLTSSEKLTDEMRAVFKEVYHCKTFDSWGSVEACGLVTECEYGSLHINPDAGLIEVLDENMQPVQPGVQGNVYCTGFLNYDQPLIRYAIGDTFVMDEKNCACGRNMPVIKEISGRTEDVIRGTDGRLMVRFH
ncbi:MAG TPA: hypothetical protein PL045_00145, partial [Chitinophagaceae bacterium]|nr:hypothetical protein [Chitinophagaceae bacterium]